MAAIASPSGLLAVFGIGPMELIILALLIVCPATVVGIVLVVALASRDNRGQSNPSLVPCPDCGRAISRQAPACPHCGRPMTPS